MSNLYPILYESGSISGIFLESGSLVHVSGNVSRLALSGTVSSLSAAFAAVSSSWTTFSGSTFPAFSSSVSSSLNGKVSKAGDTMTGALTISAQASSIGDGSQNKQLIINGGGPSSSGSDLVIIKSAQYPYIQFINNNSGGATGDGLKIGLEDASAAYIAMLENLPLKIQTNATNRMVVQRGGLVQIGVEGGLTGSNTILSVGPVAGSFGGSSYAAVHFVDNTVNATVNYQNTLVSGYTAFDFFNSSGTKTATFAWSNASAAFTPGTMWISTRTSSDFWLGTNTTERIRITSAGNVGIGTSSPSALLHVSGSAKLGGDGTAILGVKIYTPTLTPVAVVLPATTQTETFSVSGLSTSDSIFVNQPAQTSGIVIAGYRVSATNTLEITWANALAVGNATPATGTYRIVAIRS